MTAEYFIYTGIAITAVLGLVGEYLMCKKQRRRDKRKNRNDRR